MFLQTGDRTAIIEKGRHISYNEVHQRVNAIASLYPKNSNGKAAIYSENRSGWVYSFYSAWYNEYTVVPIDSMNALQANLDALQHVQDQIKSGASHQTAQVTTDYESPAVS